MTKIGFIGTGNMATALIKSIKSAGNYPIISSDKDKGKLSRAEKELGIQTTLNNEDLVENSDIIFLCVKPKGINEVLEEIKSSIKNKIIVSIAAGIKISSIESIIGKDKKLVRVMPNVNCIAGEMAAAYSCNKNVEKSDKKIINDLLNKSGIALEVNEQKMNAVTALSGSGPAFVAYLINSFTAAAEKQGLSKETAYKLALQTFFGTSRLLQKTKIAPNELIKMVSSPGGTTVKGLEIFEKSGIKKIINKTLEAAVKRSKELGK
jgi:pyrroline-5-carboxylate reductase